MSEVLEFLRKSDNGEKRDSIRLIIIIKIRLLKKYSSCASELTMHRMSKIMQKTLRIFDLHFKILNSSFFQW